MKCMRRRTYAYIYARIRVQHVLLQEGQFPMCTTLSVCFLRLGNLEEYIRRISWTGFRAQGHLGCENCRALKIHLQEKGVSGTSKQVNYNRHDGAYCVSSRVTSLHNDEAETPNPNPQTLSLNPKPQTSNPNP